MRLRSALVLVALAMRSGVAGEAAAPAAPDTPEQAAGKVLGAFAAIDEAALKVLAARDEPDPWLVADVLMVRGEFDGAAAFAAAAPRGDVDRLPEYVGARRGQPREEAAYRLLRGACEALAAGRFAEVLASTESLPPEPRTIVNVVLAHARAQAADAGGIREEADAAYGRSASGAGEMGWLSRQAGVLADWAESAAGRGDADRALALYEARLGIEERRPNPAGMAAAHGDFGSALEEAGEYARALEHEERALRLYEGLGDEAGVARMVGSMGRAHRMRGDFALARECFERSLGIAEALGDSAGAAAMVANVGLSFEDQGDHAQALVWLERALKSAEELGDRALLAATLGNLGHVHGGFGDFTRALEFHQRSLRIDEDAGNRSGVASSLHSIGSVYALLGDFTHALEIMERAGKLAEELGDPAGVVVSVQNLGATYQRLGDYAKAREFMLRALRLAEEIEHGAAIMMSLECLGIIHHCVGDLARALEFLERAFKLYQRAGDREGVARSLEGMGLIRADLGDPEGALELLERALKLEEEIGNRAAVASTLVGAGNVYSGLGEHATALDYMQRAAALLEEVGDRMSAGAVLGNIGLILQDLGDWDRALQHEEEAFRVSEEVGNPAAAAAALANIGSIHEHFGDFPRALETLGRARARLSDLGVLDHQVTVLTGLARVHRAQSDPRAAVACAREAVSILPRLVGSVGTELGASARSHWSGVFAAGALAAMDLGDPAEAAYFLESGRAGALLESFSTRAALSDHAIEPALRSAEIDARAEEARSSAALKRALAGRDVASVKAAREELERARRAIDDAVERIQRASARAASIVYPKPDDVALIRSRLATLEAFVAYGVYETESIALVVTSEDARVVLLPPSDDLRSACDGLVPGRGEGGPTPALSDLRRRLLDPLALPPSVRRVFVSPDAQLCFVPFALLAPEREWVYEPSATVYGLLLDERAKCGEGVLALGDPEYSGDARDASDASQRSGQRLRSLPGTREEAKQVGTVTLLGREATETRLAGEIVKRPRWCAVHLACHGLVDAEQPKRSALAVTPDATSDGFLSVLDVMRMDIPADLVVLSACETGKGRVVHGEGLIGFARAFMFAGAPRVIVSLWKVDDEATKALMVKFYELWNPKDGSKGLACATALKRAQEFVASHEKWKDPKYWAAWQLWGLPE